MHPADLAGGFSDLEMTWLLYCAGAATASQLCQLTAENMFLHINENFIYFVFNIAVQCIKQSSGFASFCIIIRRVYLCSNCLTKLCVDESSLH